MLTGAELFVVVQNGVTKKTTLSLTPGGSGGSGGALLSRTILITADELKETTGTILSWNLIPALGANKIAVPLAILWHGIFNGTEFTVTAPLHVSYGAQGLTDYTALPLLSTGDDHPSQDLLKQTADADDYSVLNWQVALGFATPDNPILPTLSASSLVADTPVVVWTPANTWLVGDSDLRVTIFYCAYDVTGEGTIPGVNNDAFAVTDGIVETIHDISTDPLPLSAGFYEFRNLPVSYNSVHWQQNVANPFVITYGVTPPNVGAFVINYPCIYEVTLNANGITAQTPFSMQMVAAHAAGPEVYGASANVDPTPYGAALRSVLLSGTSGPYSLFVPPDVWDGSLDVVDFGLGGTLINISQIDFSIKVLAVLGRVLTWSINATGSGYAVGDVVENTDGYIRGLWQITSVNGSGGVTGATLLDPGLGYYVTGVARPTAAVTGVGTGFTLDILTVST